MASITALASKISTETDKLAKYIEQNDLPDPSFAVDGPVSFPIPTENSELQSSRLSLMRAAEDLRMLALGPVESLRWQAWNQYCYNVSIHTIMRYRIPEAIPLDQPISFAAIAGKTKINEALVTRLLRHAMISHIFCEPVPGHVAHTLSSASLLQNTSVRDWLDMTFEEWGPASVNAADAFAKYPASEEPHETGFGIAFKGQTIFQYLSERPERAKVFGSAMGNFSKGVSHKVEHLVEGYDWKRLGKETVVDIGGSHGHISIAIANSAPDLSFVVQDLPYTAADGERLLPASYKSQISFLGHDMNNIQPIRGAALYLFRSVLLNWPDKYVIKFLKNLIPALKPGARVLINEGCLPEPGELSAWDDRLLRNLDLCMQAMFNSKERTVEEWKGLFKSASSDFKFLGAKRPAQGLLWIVEAVWEGTESLDGVETNGLLVNGLEPQAA